MRIRSLVTVHTWCWCRFEFIVVHLNGQTFLNQGQQKMLVMLVTLQQSAVFGIYFCHAQRLLCCCGCGCFSFAFAFALRSSSSLSSVFGVFVSLLHSVGNSDSKMVNGNAMGSEHVVSHCNGGLHVGVRNESPDLSKDAWLLCQIRVNVGSNHIETRRNRR